MFYFFSFRLAQIASVQSKSEKHMNSLIGPINAFSMSRVLSFTNHWNVLHVTPGAISSKLRVSILVLGSYSYCREECQNTERKNLSSSTRPFLLKLTIHFHFLCAFYRTCHQSKYKAFFWP